MSKPIQEWDSVDSTEWLLNIDTEFIKYVACFVQYFGLEGFNGHAILSLSESLLKDGIGITDLGVCKRILGALDLKKAQLSQNGSKSPPHASLVVKEEEGGDDEEETVLELPVFQNSSAPKLVPKALPDVKTPKKHVKEALPPRTFRTYLKKHPHERIGGGLIYGLGLREVQLARPRVAIYHVYDQAPRAIQRGSLRAGDTIKQINEKKVKLFSDVESVLDSLQNFEEYSVTVFRPKRRTQQYLKNAIFPEGTRVIKKVDGAEAQGTVQGFEFDESQPAWSLKLEGLYTVLFNDGHTEKMEHDTLAKQVARLPELPFVKPPRVVKAMTPSPAPPPVVVKTEESSSEDSDTEEAPLPQLEVKVNDPFEEQAIKLMIKAMDCYRQANPNLKEIYPGQTRIEKEFEGFGMFQGVVEKFEFPYYSVRYDDGDDEELDEDEIRKYMIQSNDNSTFCSNPKGLEQPTFYMNSLTFLSDVENTAILDYLVTSAGLLGGETTNIKMVLKDKAAKEVFSEMLQVMNKTRREYAAAVAAASSSAPIKKKHSRKRRRPERGSSSGFKLQQLNIPNTIEVVLQKCPDMGLHLVAEDDKNSVLVAGISGSAPDNVRHQLCEGDQIVQFDKMPLINLQKVELVIQAMTQYAPDGEIMELRIVRGDPHALHRAKLYKNYAKEFEDSVDSRTINGSVSSSTKPPQLKTAGQKGLKYPTPRGCISIPLVKTPLLGLGLGACEDTKKKSKREFVMITYFTSSARKQVRTHLQVHDVIMRIDGQIVHSLPQCLRLLTIIPKGNTFQMDIYRPTPEETKAIEDQDRKTQLDKNEDKKRPRFDCQDYGTMTMNYENMKSLGVEVEEDNTNRKLVIKKISATASELTHKLLRVGDCISCVNNFQANSKMQSVKQMARVLEAAMSTTSPNCPGKLTVYFTGDITSDPFNPTHKVPLFENLSQEVSEALDQLVCNVISKVLDPPARVKSEFSFICSGAQHHNTANDWEVCKVLEDLLQAVSQDAQNMSSNTISWSSSSQQPEMEDSDQVKAVLEDIMRNVHQGANYSCLQSEGIMQSPPLSPTSSSVKHAVDRLVHNLEQKALSDSAMLEEARQQIGSMTTVLQTRSPLSGTVQSKTNKANLNCGRVLDARKWVHPDIFTNTTDSFISQREEQLVSKEGPFILI